MTSTTTMPTIATETMASTTSVQNQSSASVIESTQYKVSFIEDAKKEADAETSVTAENPPLRRYVSQEEVNVEDMRQTYIVTTYRHLSKDFDIEASGESVSPNKTTEDVSEELCNSVLSEAFLELAGNLAKMNGVEDVIKCEKEQTGAGQRNMCVSDSENSNMSSNDEEDDKPTSNLVTEPDGNAKNELSMEETTNHVDIINTKMASLECESSTREENVVVLSHIVNSDDTTIVCKHPELDTDNLINAEFSAETITTTTCSIIETKEHSETVTKIIKTVTNEVQTTYAAVNDSVQQHEEQIVLNDSDPERNNLRQDNLFEKVHENDNTVRGHVQFQSLEVENQDKECTTSVSVNVQQMVACSTPQTQTEVTNHDRDFTNIIYHIDDTRKSVLKELWNSKSDSSESTQQEMPAKHPVIDQLTITQLLEEETEMTDIPVKPLPVTVKVPVGKLKTSNSTSQLHSKSGVRKVHFKDVPLEHVYQSFKIQESENKMSVLMKDFSRSKCEVDYFQDELDRQKVECQSVPPLVEPVGLEKLTINELLSSKVSRMSSKKEEPIVDKDSFRDFVERTIDEQIEQQVSADQTSNNEWSMKITVEEHTLVTYDSGNEENTGETVNEPSISYSFLDNEIGKAVNNTSDTNNVNIQVNECEDLKPASTDCVEPLNQMTADRASIETTETVTEKELVVSRNEDSGKLNQHDKKEVDDLPMFYLKASSSDNDSDSSSAQDADKFMNADNGHLVEDVDSGLDKNGNPSVIEDKSKQSRNEILDEGNSVVKVQGQQSYSPVSLDYLYLDEFKGQQEKIEADSRVEDKRTVVESLTISDLLVRHKVKGTCTTQYNEKKKEIDFFKEELEMQKMQANSNTNDHIKSPEATLEKMSLSDLLESENSKSNKAKPSNTISEHNVTVETEKKLFEYNKNVPPQSVQVFMAVNSFNMSEKRQNTLPKIEEEEQLADTFVACDESTPHINETFPETKGFYIADKYELESSSDSDDEQAGLANESEKYSGEILLDSCEMESSCESDFDEPTENIVTEQVTDSKIQDVSKTFLSSSGIKGLVEVKEKISLKQYAAVQSDSAKQTETSKDHETSKSKNSSVLSGNGVRDDSEVSNLQCLEVGNSKKDINGNEETVYEAHLKVTNVSASLEEAELNFELAKKTVSKTFKSSEFRNDRLDQADVDSYVILSTSAQDEKQKTNSSYETTEHDYVNVDTIEMGESDNESEINVFTDEHTEEERQFLSNNNAELRSSYQDYNADDVEVKYDSFERLQNNSTDELEKTFDADIEQFFQSGLKDFLHSESFQDDEHIDVATENTDASQKQRGHIEKWTDNRSAETKTNTMSLFEADVQFAKEDINNLRVNEYGYISSTSKNQMLDRNESVENNVKQDRTNKIAVVNVETKSESMKYTEKQLSVFTKETWEKFKIHRSENDITQQDRTWSESSNTSASMSLDALQISHKEKSVGQRTVSSDSETTMDFLRKKHYSAKRRLELNSETGMSRESVFSSILDSMCGLDILQDLVDDNHTWSADMSMGIGVCCRCGEGFGQHQQIVNSNGEVWHPQCFVCAQCFQPFPDGVFYEFEGRKYCEHDFHVLFAPCCGKCGEFIVGRVIKALNYSWHPDCFRCQLCDNSLADTGFVKNAGRALCRDCNAHEKARAIGKYVCHKCHAIIEEGHIKYKGEAFHPYHFNCNSCSVELNADAREVNGELYCLRCHDKMGIPICGACRRPIEERVVHALGKAWHVEHFVCAKCEKPFFGTRHYEKKGLAYCEIHYHQLFGNICFTCNSVISGDVFHAFNKAWHVNHFGCSICDRKMSQKTKFFEFDLKPVCKFCYEKFPAELRKRLKKAYDEQNKK